MDATSALEEDCPRQPEHADVLWRTPPGLPPVPPIVPRGCERIFTFLSGPFICVETPSNPGSAPSATPIDTVDGVILSLRARPSDWAELSRCSPDIDHARLVESSAQVHLHSGLDPQRPWDLVDSGQAFFAKVAVNYVTTRRSAGSIPSHLVQSNSSSPSGCSSDGSGPRKRARTQPPLARREALKVRDAWRHIGTVSVGTAPSSVSPVLSPGHLSKLGEQALLAHLQSLWDSKQSPVNFLMAVPPPEGMLPRPDDTGPLNWARPAMKPNQKRPLSKRDRQLLLRLCWVPALNALLREAMESRALSSASGRAGRQAEVGQLFWIREDEVSEYLPKESPNDVFLLSEKVTTQGPAGGQGGSVGGQSSSSRRRAGAGRLGLADFYLMYRRTKADQIRVAAALELKPHVQLSFLAHALLCCLGDVEQASVRSSRCSPSDRRATSLHNKAQHLLHQLLSQMCASAAPLCILLTGFQLLVIERKDADVVGAQEHIPGCAQKLHLALHDVAYSAPVPKTLLERTPQAAQAVHGQCSFPNADDTTHPPSFAVNDDEHLIARLLSLSLRAAERCEAPVQENPDQRFRPFWLGEGLDAEDDTGVEDDTGGKEQELSREGLGGAGGEAGVESRAAEMKGAGEGAEAAPRDQEVPVGENAGERDSAILTPFLNQRTHPFAWGAHATAHVACITRKGLGCPFFIYPQGPEQCKRTEGHTLCIAKRPRGLLPLSYDYFDSEDSEYSDERVEQNAEGLRKERAFYMLLRPLQGDVLPRFLGRFGSGVFASYAYEDAGFSLDDRDLFDVLSLDGGDIDDVCAQLPELLHRLHRKGFAHCDVALRNFCASRPVARIDEEADTATQGMPHGCELTTSPSAGPTDAAQSQTPPALPPQAPLGAFATPSTPAWAADVCRPPSLLLPPTPAAMASPRGSGSEVKGRDVRDSSLDSTTGQQAPIHPERQRVRAPIVVRLIDLSSAREISCLPAEEADRLIRKDLRRVQKAIDEFRNLALP